MRERGRNLAFLFTVAMTAMLLGAVASGGFRAEPVEAADTLAPAAASPATPPPVARGGAVTLDTFRDIARSRTAGVVNINTARVDRAQPRSRDPFRDFFGDDLMDRFFGPGGEGPRQTQRSLGSGFVVDKDGYILTNRHVIEGADQVQVFLANNRRYDARVVGKDARTDVALIKIEPKEDLTVLTLGDSAATEPGEWVMAIGNPFGYGNSVTVGVVSYIGRSINLNLRAQTPTEMIQTDAAINPGNSGGPLLNTRGEVVGINTLIMTNGLPQSAGVGFAVPINVAKDILPQLRERGKVVRGYMGVLIGPVTEDLARTYKLKEARGAIVSEVTAGSPADLAGLQHEDVVLSADGRAVADANELTNYVASKAPGTTVQLRVLRAGAEKTVPVTLGTFPEEAAAGTPAEEGEEGASRLGMRLRPLSAEMAERLELPRGMRGLAVLSVEAGSRAEEAGLRPRDILLSLNGEPLASIEAFEREVERARPDGVARLRVRRGDQHLITTLRLE
jgi:serine protease Do